MKGPIRFGTSGWRGVLADEVTLPRARALAAAVARWLDEEGGRRILVAHDTRSLGPELARAAARVLAGAGARVVPVASPAPTPVVTHAVRRREADAALIFTASHNTAAYHGAKVIAAWGGGVTGAQARRIEALSADALAHGPAREARVGAPEVDLSSAYAERLAAWIDRGAFRRAPMAVVYDALHGAGGRVCERVLRALGVRVEVLRGAPGPRFGGVAPDPVPALLGALAARVRASRARLGLATDGDADRYAVVDADGSVLSATEALALLVDRLARTGRVRRGLAISIATGSLVERVAAGHGLRVARHPIGFASLSRALADGAADVAGEESGGFAVDAFGRDKDGILACALLAELAAERRAPLRERLRELARRHGPSVCGRIALAAGPAARERLARLVEAPPERVEGAPVRTVETLDGLRLGFDDGFLMLRASGTEPVLRVYAEAPARRALARRFEAGRRLLDAGLRDR